MQKLYRLFLGCFLCCCASAPLKPLPTATEIPLHLSKSPKTKHLSLVLQGSLAHSLDDETQADLFFKQALKENPDAPYLYEKLGLLDLGLQHFPRDNGLLLAAGKRALYQAEYLQALELLKKTTLPFEVIAPLQLQASLGLNKTPEFLEQSTEFSYGMMIQIAIIFEDYGQMKKALEWYEKIEQLHPRDDEAVAGKKRIACWLKKSDAAACLLQNKFDEVYISKKLSNELQKIETLAQKKYYAQAIQSLQKNLVNEPDNPIVLNALGFTLLEAKQQFKAAEVYLRKAFRLLKSIAVIDSLGWLFYQQKNYCQAKEWLLQAKNFAPNDAEILAHLKQVNKLCSK